LDGHWLKEAANKEAVLERAGDEALWFSEVDEKHTTIYAQFKAIDPNQHTVENMRIEGNHFSEADTQLVQKDHGIYLQFESNPELAGDENREIVSSQTLGTSIISGLPFKLPDGTDFIIDKDYFGKERNHRSPDPGPFHAPSKEKVSLKVWPVK
jgi:hypothetical protein